MLDTPWMEACDACHGRGYNEGIACPPGRRFRVDCTACNASGQVLAGSQDARRVEVAIAEGKRLNRIARGVSMADEAKAMGITPLELSKMEHGMLPWPGMEGVIK